MPVGMLALMRGKKSEAEMPETEDESGEEDDYAAAASEILAAIKGNDASSLAEALKSFVSAC